MHGKLSNTFIEVLLAIATLVSSAVVGHALEAGVAVDGAAAAERSASQIVHRHLHR